MPKKRTLPKDFYRSLGVRPLDELTAVYDEHLLTAYQAGDRSKRTPLFWPASPNGLIEWLVQQGLDVNEPDADGVSALFAQAESGAASAEKVRLLIRLGAEVDRRSPSAIGGEFTPLHIAAFRGAGPAVEALLEHGAEADALDGEGRTALARGIARANLRTLDALPGVVAPLVAAGAQITPEMRDAVELLGREIRAVAPGSAAVHAERRAAAYAALARLFELGATPAEPGAASDGEIFVPRASWAAQYRSLWTTLVPASGHAANAQGEAIRITGRIRNELIEMGGVNWDTDHQAMLDHLPALFALGSPLDETTLVRARENARKLGEIVGTPQAEQRMTELQQAAVAWVAQNTLPIPLDPPGYRR